MTDLPRVLIVDDDEIHRKVVRRLLGDEFYLLDAETGSEALDALASVELDCVLLDYQLPDYTGLELLPDLKALALPVLMFTSLATQEFAELAKTGGALDYIQKDQLTRETLRDSIMQALKHSPRKSRTPA